MATTDRSTPADLEQATDVFLTASRALVGISVRSLAASPVEVTLPQHRLLVLLAAHGEQTIGVLAERLGINQSNASRLVDRLERLDLVRRRRSDVDGRAVAVTIQASGRAVLDAVTAHRRREIAGLLARLSPAERDGAALGMAAFDRAAGERADAEWTV